MVRTHLGIKDRKGELTVGLWKSLTSCPCTLETLWQVLPHASVAPSVKRVDDIPYPIGLWAELNGCLIGHGAVSTKPSTQVVLCKNPFSSLFSLSSPKHPQSFHSLSVLFLVRSLRIPAGEDT